MAHIPTEGELLIEPFMGGCTVALNLEYKNMILRDMNPDLVTLCNWVSKTQKQSYLKRKSCLCLKITLRKCTTFCANDIISKPTLKTSSTLSLPKQALV